MTDIIIPDLPDDPGSYNERPGVSVMRKQTERFIDEMPTDIALIRSQRTSDGAGGYTQESVSVDPQTFRVIEQNNAGSNVQLTNVYGTQDRPDLVLLGLFDADIEDGDTFVIGDINYKITYVRLPNGYETLAEVQRG